MASDGPTPPKCDKRIMDHGTPVLVTHTIGPNGIELYVKLIAYLSKQPVDWHFVGGRARVAAMGDLTAVRAAIAELAPLHRSLMRQALQKHDIGHDRANLDPMLL